METFRELANQNKELKTLDYKKVSIVDVLEDYGYECIDEDTCEYEYSDFKAYLNLKINEILNP